MAWVTPIQAMEQVEYRLSGACGCDQEHAPDAQVSYRLGPDMEWIGRGLAEVGLVAGEEVDKDAARKLMSGINPATGERLVKLRRVTDPRSHLAAAPLVDAIAARAGEDGPQFRTKATARRFGELFRGVRSEGERHRAAVQQLADVAAAAGIALEDVYGAEELTAAREFEGRMVVNGKRGHDLVLDLPKSYSALMAVADKPTAAVMEGLFLQAARETVTAVEDWCAYAMAGHNGDGKTPTRHDTSGVLGWMTVHRSARPTLGEPGRDGVRRMRAGDPHLHVHLTMAAWGRSTVDGKWRALGKGGMDFFRHAKAADALVKARLRTLSADVLGMRWERDARTGAWEVVGVDQAVRAEFSQRTAEVVADAGPDATRQEMKAASARTREAKQDGVDPADVRAEWRERAARHVDVDAMVRAAIPGPDPGGTGPRGPDGGPRITPPVLVVAGRVLDPETGLTAHHKTFTRANALAAVMDAVPGLDSAAAGELLTDDVLALTADGEPVAVPLPPKQRTGMSNTARYTSHDVIAAEQTIVGEVTARLSSGAAQLTDDQAALAIDTFETSRGFSLSEEQTAVLHRLLTAGHGVDLVVGVAGAGKTTLMEAARLGWESTGLVVAGTSTAAVAAGNLAAEAGIPSKTAAAWLRAIEDGPGLAGVDVLVVDEGAMVDDRALAALLSEASRTGTKVVGIGDPQQLQPVGIGGGFREAHRLVAGLELSENRRQRGETERAALEAWRTGDRADAVRQLADGGAVHATATVPEAHAALIAAWDDARGEFADPHDRIERLLLMTTKNSDTAVLNKACRVAAREAGELPGADTVFALPGGARLPLAVGDVVRVRRNDYRSRQDPDAPDVLNGYRGVVRDVHRGRGALVEWRRAGPDGPVTEEAWIPPAHIARGDLSHGYAMTVASAQGLTAERAYVYGPGADAFTAYPALSRARGETHLFLALDAVEDPQTRARLGEARTDAELLHRAVEAWGAQLDADRPAGMVSHELVGPAPVPDQARRTADADARRTEARTTIPPWDQRRLGTVLHPERAADKTDAQADKVEQEEARAAVAHREAVDRAERGAGAHARALADRREQLHDAHQHTLQADAWTGHAATHERTAAAHRARLREVDPMATWSRYRLWRAGTTRDQVAAEAAALRTAIGDQDAQARTARGHAARFTRQARTSAPAGTGDVRAAHRELEDRWEEQYADAVRADRAAADRPRAATARSAGHTPADRVRTLRGHAASLRAEAALRDRLADLDPLRAAREIVDRGQYAAQELARREAERDARRQDEIERQQREPVRRPPTHGAPDRGGISL